MIYFETFEIGDSPLQLLSFHFYSRVEIGGVGVGGVGVGGVGVGGSNGKRKTRGSNAKNDQKTSQDIKNKS